MSTANWDVSKLEKFFDSLEHLCLDVILGLQKLNDSLIRNKIVNHISIYEKKWSMGYAERHKNYSLAMLINDMKEKQLLQSDEHYRREISQMITDLQAFISNIRKDIDKYLSKNRTDKSVSTFKKEIEGNVQTLEDGYGSELTDLLSEVAHKLRTERSFPLYLEGATSSALHGKPSQGQHEGSTQYDENVYKRLEEQLKEQRNKIKLITQEVDKHLPTQLRRLTEENKQLSDRLSEQMHHRIASNEENFENISIRNRSLNVAEDYSNMLTQQWMEAMDETEKTSNDEKTRHNFFHDILQISYNESMKLYRRAMAKLENPIKEPVADGTAEATTSFNVPQDIINTLGDYWREDADRTDLSILIKNIKENVDQKRYPYLYECLEREKFKSTKRFVEASALIAWKMVIQRPPLEFFSPQHGVEYDKMRHDVYYGSKDPTKHRVLYTLNPGMIQKKHTLVKAKVIFG